MNASIFQIGIYLLTAVIAGGVIGWLVRGLRSNYQIEKLQGEWQLKFDQTARQRDKFNAENHSLQASIEAQQAVLHKHESAAARGRTEIESAREKQKAMSKELLSLGAERDELNKELNNRQRLLANAKHKNAEVEAEFVKASEFYKLELGKSLEMRKSLEGKLESSKAEQDSLGNLLKASKSEYESVTKRLVAAQTRLDNLDVMERKAIDFEADNAQLRHDVACMKQEVEALLRDVAELEELKVQNRELSHCLTSMENSRKQYEADAKRYRDQAGHSEKQSETLRIKLDDVQKNLANTAKQHDEARKHVRAKGAIRKTNGKAPPEKVVDDLTRIIGIGKVFQHTLNELGIYSFQQLASFGLADIARVNMALKENKGRIEQDDWIGQAKELYFKKYSETVND